MSQTLFTLALVVPSLLTAIFAQFIPILVPVIASYLFKLLNKGTTAIEAWADWQKQLAFAVLNTLILLGVRALGLAGVPEDVQHWTQVTLEGILGAIAAMLLYDNGKSAAQPAAAAP